MRTIYLKESKKEWPFGGNNYHWKVAETPTGCTTVTVTKDSITVGENDDFFDEVSFIKKKLCDGDNMEITKMEFDTNYVKTAHLINDAMNIGGKPLEDEMAQWAKDFDNGLIDILRS